MVTGITTSDRVLELGEANETISRFGSSNFGSSHFCSNLCCSRAGDRFGLFCSRSGQWHLRRKSWSTNRLQVLAMKRSEEEELLDNATARAKLRELGSSRLPQAFYPIELDVQVSELAKLAVVEAERVARDEGSSQWWTRTCRIQSPSGRVVWRTSFQIAIARSSVAGTHGGGWGRRCPPFRWRIPRFAVNVLVDR